MSVNLRAIIVTKDPNLLFTPLRGRSSNPLSVSLMFCVSGKTKLYNGAQPIKIRTTQNEHLLYILKFYQTTKSYFNKIGGYPITTESIILMGLDFFNGWPLLWSSNPSRVESLREAPCRLCFDFPLLQNRILTLLNRIFGYPLSRRKVGQNPASHPLHQTLMRKATMDI